MTIPALLSQQAKLQRAVKNAATSTEKINLLQQLSTINDALRAALKNKSIMKTHKQSFEELRALAPCGPFYRRLEPWSHCICTKNEHGDIGFAEIDRRSTTSREVSAEAVTRLLNAFVAGDGLQVLRDAECLCKLAYDEETAGKLRALIAQLDGHANTD